MHDVFEFRNSLIEDYKRFSSSFSSPSAEDIKGRLKAAYEAGRYWSAPLLQINPNYQKGETILDLANRGVVTEMCAKIFQVGKQENTPQPITLYKHQQEALALVEQKKSYVVTTGTGSGKSLTFFIPIINRILSEKAADPVKRTRAVIVYPMNALANSQLEEIEKFLCDFPPDQRPVTVARYTGQETASQRSDLKKNPPDILLTNYVMLDLILTRHHEDHEVVEHCQNLEFLVLDELHTYRGRQGADVAMLVRRLKTQFNTPNVLCIGTSATMASMDDAQDQKTAIAGVASRLFDTTISPECVIQETLEYSTKAKSSDLTFQQQLASRIGKPHEWQSVEDFKSDPLAVWIETRLGIVEAGKTKNLVRATPHTLDEAAELLAKDVAITKDEAHNLLTSFLAALYQKEDWPGKRPPLAFKLHQFISGPGQVMTSLEPAGKRAVELDSQRFAPGRQKEGVLLFPTHFCRKCGREYLPVWVNETAGTVTPRDISDTTADDDNDNTRIAAFLCPIKPDSPDEKLAPGTEMDDARLPDEFFEITKKGEYKIRDNAKDNVPKTIHATAKGELKGGAKSTHWLINGKYRFCLDCGDVPNTGGRDANRLVGISGEGRSSATTIITLAALRQMFAEGAPENAKDDVRKMLGFTDNRQDAALQSGHFNEFIFLVSLRAGLVRALSQNPGGIGAEDIANKVFSALGFDSKDPAVKAAYLANPDIAGMLLRNAQGALRFMLGYRLLEDLCKEWRYNNPNLEQLSLLTIDYLDIEEFAKDDGRFTNDPILAKLTPAIREKLARCVFDQLRKALCFCKTTYMQKSEQEKAAIAGANLCARWQLQPDQSGNLVLESDLYLYRSAINNYGNNEKANEIRNALKKGSAKSGSKQSAFFKNIAKADFWSETEYCRHGSSYDGDKDELFNCVQSLLLAACKYGFVETRFIGDTVLACSLNAQCVVWKPAGESGAANTNKFFRKLYKDVAELLATDPARFFMFESHEHTAQVEPELRRILEQRFRFRVRDKEEYAADGHTDALKRLPVMYCSPTMELGVDISSLNMVYMRNVPPTAANYAQRSGRAGRSGQAALALTYCTSLSPHDQWFYHKQGEMVHGEVRVPAIDLTNRELFDSHIHAIWLSCVDVDLPTLIFDLLEKLPDDNPTLNLLAKFKDAFGKPEVAEKSVAIASQIASKLESELNRTSWWTPHYIEDRIKESPAAFDESLNRWRDLYRAIHKQMTDANRILSSAGATSKEKEIARATLLDAYQQDKVLTSSSQKNSDFYLYRYLASQGFLPGYSFPRLPIIAWLPRAKGSKRDEGTMIARPRFLALSEFGPRSLIYHEGSTYRVNRVKLQASSVEHVAANGRLGTIDAAICDKCGYSSFKENEHGASVEVCPLCGNVLEAEKTQIRELYKIDAVEASPNARITVRDEERERQGFDIQTSYSFKKAANGEIDCITLTVGNGTEKLLEMTYSAAADIWRINKGWRRRADKTVFGFYINPLNGQWSKQGDPNAEPSDPGGKEKHLQRIVPYVRDFRNVLIVTPNESIAGKRTEMATFSAALMRAMQQVFQVETSEIAAEFLPSSANPQKILVYEASEGGAGVLGTLATGESRAKILNSIAREALEVMHYRLDEETGKWIEEATDCEAGCYRCLLSYYNQTEHEFIDRRNEAVKQCFEKLLKIGECDFVGQKKLSASAPQQSPFLAEVARRSLKMPTATNHPLKCGTTCDAFYKQDRKLVFDAPVAPEVESYAAARGFSIIVFPSDPSQWDSFFTAQTWLEKV